MKSLLCSAMLCLTVPAVRSVTCDCNYGGSFLKTAKQTKVVALIKVLKYRQLDKARKAPGPLAMDVEVIKSYKGSRNSVVITVGGDDGANCRPYITTFGLNRVYIVALYETGEGERSDTNYSIANCGEYWLSVDMQAKTVTGDINSANRTRSTSSLLAFESALKNILGEGQ